MIRFKVVLRTSILVRRIAHEHVILGETLLDDHACLFPIGYGLARVYCQKVLLLQEPLFSGVCMAFLHMQHTI